jgi:hypothetical protein
MLLLLLLLGAGTVTGFSGSRAQWELAVRRTESNGGCPPGTYAQYNSGLACLVCPPGRADSDFDAVTACELCPPGTYAGGPGYAAVECTRCPAGRVGRVGEAGCTDCPEGSFSAAVGSTAGCRNCTGGECSYLFWLGAAWHKRWWCWR